jgi:hypothetical protein
LERNCGFSVRSMIMGLLFTGRWIQVPVLARSAPIMAVSGLSKREGFECCLLRRLPPVGHGGPSLDELGDGVAANTVKIRDLLTTASVLKQIRAEVRIHDDYLASQ